MKTKELADELMIWLPKLSAGKTLEAIYFDGEITEFDTIDALCCAIRQRHEIRIKQISVTEMPEPPENETWHNPAVLTRKQIGIDDGWRLLLESEIGHHRARPICEIWCYQDKWSDMPAFGDLADTTYRVNAEKYPVGSLRPISAKQVRIEIADDLKRLNHGISSLHASALASSLFAGKIRHIGLK